MVADTLVYHPVVSHYLRYVATTVGRDKVLRTIQYFSRFYAWYLYRTNEPSSAIEPWSKVKAQLGVTRKILRVGKWVEHVRAAAEIYDASQKSNNGDKIAQYLQLARQAGYAGYLFFDALTVPDAIGFRKSESTKQLQARAFRFWFAGLLASALAGVYATYRLQTKAKALNEKDAESKVEGVKIASRQAQAVRIQLLSDLCDLTVPASALGYADIDDGLVGLLGVLSSLIALGRLGNVAKDGLIDHATSTHTAPDRGTFQVNNIVATAIPGRTDAWANTCSPDLTRDELWVPKKTIDTPRPVTPGVGESNQARTEVFKANLKAFRPAMGSNSVNKTALHPAGVQPGREHTELEEELHTHANIDYDRVAIVANPSVSALYEDALVYETGSAITSSGALTAYSGSKTGRSPSDKRIVKEASSEKDVWWGPVNKAMTPEVWKINHERAIDYLNTRNRIYVVDGYAGWDERYRISVRVICARAYHALFMRNMLIRPTRKELEHFHPDYTIYNAGTFPANRYTTGMTSATSVAINFAEKEMVILGTEYAGEMKKGIFTVLFYEMPVKHNVLTLHSSANEGEKGDVTVFFGLSGTGKTTLSADPKRKLIGDDEHCWSDRGVFNIEGGCYAKCIGLSAEKEPDIYGAIRFGSVLENVVFNPETREVDYDDATLTENTRCAYPIEYIQNAKIPCVTENHPSNIILLTCDARGVLPPISKLDTNQTMFHFISGYTSKMAGTEDGVTEPQATFSSCFAQPFLALHPMRYAKMLADKISEHNANAWLLNTGWVGAGAATGGKRCPLKYTRAILDAIHSGELAKTEYEVYPIFNLSVPKHCPNVPDELLNPKKSWTGTAVFEDEVTKLARLFKENFAKYSDEATPEVIKAGPEV
ncbi:hypothetical protein DV735_g1693, partial [Chaetothyriales sp. CBS 134920]